MAPRMFAASMREIDEREIRFLFHETSSRVAEGEHSFVEHVKALGLFVTVFQIVVHVSRCGVLHTAKNPASAVENLRAQKTTLIGLDLRFRSSTPFDAKKLSMESLAACRDALE